MQNSLQWNEVLYYGQYLTFMILWVFSEYVELIVNGHAVRVLLFHGEIQGDMKVIDD